MRTEGYHKFSNEEEYNEKIEKTITKKTYLSIVLLNFAVFLCGLQITYVYPFLAYYITSLNTSKTIEHNVNIWLSIIYFIFSIGQMLGNWFYGFLATYIKESIIVSVNLIIIIVCTFFVFYGNLWPTEIRIEMLIVFRAILGFSTGIVAVSRSFAVKVFPTPELRQKVLASLAGTQVLGMGISSFLSVFFSFFKSIKGKKSDYINHYPVFDTYSLPSAVLFVFGIIILIILPLMLSNSKTIIQLFGSLSNDVRTKPGKRASVIEQAGSDVLIRSAIQTTQISKSQLQWYWIGTILLDFCWFAYFASNASMVLSVVLGKNYAYSSSRAVTISSYVLIIGSLSGTCLYFFCYFTIHKYIKPQILLVIGWGVYFISYFILIPFYGKDIASHTNGAITNTTSSTCDYSWCDSQKAVPSEIYVVSTSVQAACGGLHVILITVLHAKFAEKTHREILQQTVYSIIGSIGRAMGPVFVLLLYQYGGMLLLFTFLSALTGCAFISSIIVTVISILV